MYCNGLLSNKDIYIYNEDFIEKQRPEKAHSKNILGIHRMH